jgi:predicted phosphodiesterase
LADNPYAPRLKEPEPFDAVASEHEMLLLVSDAHFPEIVNPEEALGISYGPETVRRRMEHITDRTKRLFDLHEANYPVQKLTIAVLGDMLSGNIHEELEITNAMPMGDALTEMSYMLFDMGRILSEDVNVEMIIMPGNHPRMTKKPRNKQKWDNFEYIMGKMVEALAGDAFKVTVPKDLIYTHEIFDLNVGMTHGDGSKAASFAGIPFYGLKQRSQATQAMRSTLGYDRLDMLCMGHFHQHLIWTEGDCHIVINGAIKGGDEYSIATRSSASEPVQALLTFHKDRGHINTERIPLGDIV